MVQTLQDMSKILAEIPKQEVTCQVFFQQSLPASDETHWSLRHKVVACELRRVQAGSMQYLQLLWCSACLPSSVLLIQSFLSAYLQCPCENQGKELLPG